MSEEMVTITRVEYEELLESAMWETALRQAGVGNWDGYDWAMEILGEMTGDNT